MNDAMKTYRNFLKFVLDLKELNPKQCIVYDPDAEIPTIYCNCNPNSLVLPKNYYLSDSTIMPSLFTVETSYEFFACYQDDEIANS